MIVHHRPQDVGTATEYTMAMHRADFILLHELVKMKIQELGPISQTEETVVKYFALLRVIDMAMQHAQVEPIPLPETLRRIGIMLEAAPSLRDNKRRRKKNVNPEDLEI